MSKAKAISWTRRVGWGWGGMFLPSIRWVYLIGNEADDLIGKVTRLLGQSELRQMAFTAIHRRNS